MNPREHVACDIGPILALINRRDQFHQSCVEALNTVPFPLYTVWPVIVEAFYLIQRYGGPAEIVFHWVQAGHLRIMDLRGPEIRRADHDVVARDPDTFFRVNPRQVTLSSACL